MKNILTVKTMDHIGRTDTMTYEDCSFTVDNCDHSIRVEKKSDTVAHFDDWTYVKQEIVR